MKPVTIHAAFKFTMKFWTAIILLIVLVAQIFAYPAYESDAALSDEVLGKFYRSFLKAKRSPKRSPSIGLSLAEYMASPQGQDNFHFIPSGRK
uniref:Uncharacterized protein n=1 Tax=Panagrolaimus sp. PS1159 TaxID=55785 RepID=A0AC35F9W3_9BILA